MAITLMKAMTAIIITASTEAMPYFPCSTDPKSSMLARFMPGETMKAIAPIEVMPEVKMVMKLV